MTKLLGNGIIDIAAEVPDPKDRQIRDLRDRVADLEADLDRAREETGRAKRDAGKAVAALRRQLAPLYHALGAIFGEMDAAGLDAPPVSTASSPVAGTGDAQGIWAAWKQKLPPACGKIIDALLAHGELNAAQLKVACRLGTSTVGDGLGKMYKLGLLNKNASRYSLKNL